MLVTVLSLLSFCGFVLGAPFPSPSNLITTPLNPRDEVRFATNYRSTPEIIWTCLITTFLCTWVSMHPNVAGYNADWWRSLRPRVLLFLRAFAAPEVPLGAALLQWMGAKKIADEIGHGWTPVYGFFLQMGGIIFRIDGQLRYLEASQLIAPPDELHRAARRELERLPTTEKEILDRSKGDAVTKGLTALQTLWFIVLLAARRIQNLTVTALEVLTLAYAVLNLVVYIFWWNKPLNVQCPIIIDVALGSEKTESGSSPSDQTKEKDEDQPSAVCASLLAKAERPSGLETSLTSSQTVPTVVLEHDGTDTFVKFESNIRWILIPNGGKLFLHFIIVAILSGAVYFIAWSFTFPVPIGRTLWRVCCVFVTIGLFGGAFLSRIAQLIVCRLVTAFSPSTQIGSEVWGKYFTIFLLTLYAVARLILISLALWSLHDLPPDAHETVSWSRFIPHI